jgi:hypothetical protein
MKTITQKLIKGLLVIVLFTGVSVALSTTGVQTVSEAKAAGAGGGALGGPAGQAGQVTASAVYQYLVSRGYTIQNLNPVCGTSNWQASVTNANGVQARVIIYTQSTQIVASQELPG